MKTILRVLTLFLILIAVTFFLLKVYLWDAALLLVLGIISFVISLFHSHPADESPRLDLKRLMPTNSTTWLLIAPLLTSIIVALNARVLPREGNYAPLFLLWILGVAGFCISLILPWLRLRQVKDQANRKVEPLALLGLLIAAALCRGVGLGNIPANLGGDEGSQLLRGVQLVAAPFGNPFATGWYSVPTMSFTLYGLVMRVFGVTVAGGRVLSVFAGTLTVLTTYLLGKALAGRRFGWISAIFVTFSAYHIHYSRLASNQIFDPLIGTLSFWLIWLALKGQNNNHGARLYAWGLAGVVAGMGWYAYFGARWVTVLIGLVILWRWISNRDFLHVHINGLLLFALGWLIVVLPLMGWYYDHPSPMTERFNAVSIFGSGWLLREVAITGKTAFRLLMEQFWKSATAFHLTPDPTFWYYPERPLIDLVMGGLMLAGMVVCFWNPRWPSRALILIWFWSTLFMAWVVTENPPSSQRGLSLVPPVAFLAAWGFETVRLWLHDKENIRRYVPLMLLVISILSNLGFYFVEYTPRRSYGNPTAVISTEVAQYTLNNPEPICSDVYGTGCNGMVYFLGPPRLYWKFGSLAFLLRNFPGVDVLPGELLMDINTPARFILVEDRIGEIGVVAQAYPDGEMVHIKDDQARTIALVYDWVP